MQGGRADQVVAELAEQLAEARYLLLVDVVEGLRRNIAAGDAGAAGGDHHVDLGIGDPALERRHDLCPLVGYDAAVGDAVAGAFDPLHQHPARAILGEPAGVRHREHRDVDGAEGPFLVDPDHGAVSPFFILSSMSNRSRQTSRFAEGVRSR